MYFCSTVVIIALYSALYVLWLICFQPVPTLDVVKHASTTYTVLNNVHVTKTSDLMPITGPAHI